MSSRRPYNHQRPTELLDLENQEAIDRLDRDAPRRSLGMPRPVIYTSSQKAQLGDLIPFDPSTATADSKGVYLYAHLPKGDRLRVGEKITIKNYSTSTNTIRLQPVYPDTIDKAAYKDITTAWGEATVLLIAEDKWICLAQNGCADCTGSCLASCADTCDSSCVGSCASTTSGSCSGCSGSCAAVCAGSCAGEESGSCTDCTNSCAETTSGSCAGCAGSCASTADGSCGGSCTGSCAGTCNGDCSGACLGSCVGECTATCTGGCDGSCAGHCSSTCEDGCAAYG